jgi:hypothetical protein
MTESGNSQVVLMDRLRLLWAFIVSHWLEIVLAAIFAIIFGLILDLFTPGSRLRAGIRHIKNKLSERSAARLRERIGQLEKSRNDVAAYLSSDKALYLATFRIVIGILVAMATGTGLALLNNMVPYSHLDLLAGFFYFVAIVIGIQGFKTSSLDTPAKVTAMIIKLNSEIDDLRKKLEVMAK